MTTRGQCFLVLFAKVWKSPGIGVVKLNTDFGVFREGESGFEAIVRDHEGKVLMIAVGWEPSIFSPLESEARSIIWALWALKRILLTFPCCDYCLITLEPYLDLLIILVLFIVIGR